MDYLQLQIDLSNVLNENQSLPEGRKSVHQVESFWFMHLFGKGLQMVVFKKPGSVCQPVASHNGVLWTMQQAGNLQSDDI